MSDVSEPNPWRDKYLDLKEQEDERQAVMRRGLVCVSLAVDNIDPALEQQLKSLRERLRGAWQTQELAPLVDTIEQTVRRLDERRTQGRDKVRDLFKRLVGLLDQLRPDRHQRKMLSAYLQQIEAGDGDFQQLLQTYLQLFENLIQSQAEEAKPDKVSPGLLRRLFGGKDKGGDASVEEAHPSEVAGDETAEDSGTSVQRYSAGPAIAQDGVRDRIAGVLEGLLAQMQVEFPEPVGALQQRWQTEQELEVLPELIQATLNLHQSVSAQRAKDTEAFLLALSKRLVDVYRFLAGRQEQQTRAHEEVGRFDANMRNEIEELRTHVVQASSLPTLKQDIELRVSGILKLVDTYREQTQVTGRSLHTEVQELEAKLKRMERESSKLREIVRNEHRRAMQDALTGIPNRQALQDRSRLEYQRWKRYATPLSIIMVDVDFFKRINDRFGHLAGDKVLKLVAQTLQSSVRQTDFLARYGGEEFMVILPQTSLSEAAMAGEKLRQAIEVCPFHFSGEPIKITCSMGVAMMQEGETWEQAVDRADQALLNAKRTGRNRLCSDPETA